MSNEISFKWYPGARKKLEDEFPDKLVYSIAREILDKTYQHIPLSLEKGRGKLRQSSMAYGVQGANKNYTIGSRTDYAIYVWKMNENTTNWSTPGTYSKWYINLFKRQGTQIVKSCVERNKLK